MPTYVWRCRKCGASFDVYSDIASRDEAEDCPDCGSAHVQRMPTCSAVRADLNDFSQMNNGRGIYNPQMKGWMRHTNDAKEYARKNNLNYET